MDAVPFTPSGGPLLLDQITVTVLKEESRPSPVDVLLMSDTGGLPGSVLESFHFDDVSPDVGQTVPPLVAVSTVHTLLEPGVQYWVAVDVQPYVVPGPFQYVWAWNPIGDTGPWAFYEPGSGWFSAPGGVNPRPVFRVEGVSEPSSLVMGGIACLAGLGARRRKWLTRGRVRSVPGKWVLGRHGHGHGSSSIRPSGCRIIRPHDRLE